ncbi:hypothetical protein D3C71_1436000 [compost metagenome]
MALGDGGHRGDIHDLEHRVGRGFDPDHLRLRGDRGLERGQVGQVDEAELQVGGALTHALEQAEGAAVDIVHRHHVAAGVQQLHHRGTGGHARGERETAAAAFQGRHAALVGEAGGIVGARVLKALVFAGAGLGVGGGRVDRRHHRAGARIRRLSAVDGQGGQGKRTVAVPGGSVVGHDVSQQGEPRQGLPQKERKSISGGLIGR